MGLFRDRLIVERQAPPTRCTYFVRLYKYIRIHSNRAVVGEEPPQMPRRTFSFY